jgi:hypothetical protein
MKPQGWKRSIRASSLRSLQGPLRVGVSTQVAGLGWQVLSDYFTPHFSGDRFPGVVGYPEVL